LRSSSAPGETSNLAHSACTATSSVSACKCTSSAARRLRKPKLCFPLQSAVLCVTVRRKGRFSRPLQPSETPPDSPYQTAERRHSLGGNRVAPSSRRGARGGRSETSDPLVASGLGMFGATLARTKRCAAASWTPAPVSSAHSRIS
jgi:hypothetical protein